MNRTVAFALCALAAASCGSDFDPSSRITSLRVLAVGAKKVLPSGIDPKGASWAHPGDTVELTALWDDPKNRTTQWAWATCELPTSSTVLGCFQKIAKDVQTTGKPPTFAIGTNKDVFRLTVRPDILDAVPPEALAGATIGVVLIACPGTLQQVPQASKTDLPVACVDADGNKLGTDEFIAGIKRIFIRKKDENADPVITGVTFDGQPWGEDEVKTISASCSGDENRFERCGDEGKKEIALQLDPSTFESGTDEFGVPFTEQIVVQYYATEGLFEYDVKRGQDPNTRFAGRSGRLGEQRLWIVVRDNRGGQSWIERKIRIQ